MNEENAADTVDQDAEIVADFCQEAEKLVEGVEAALEVLRGCVYSALPFDAGEYVQFLKACEPARYYETIKSVNRTVHTIKGLSAFLDFTQINRYCHTLEELTTGIAAGQLILNDEVFELISRCPGLLGRALEAIEATKTDAGLDLTGEVEDIQRCRESVFAALDGASVDVKALAEGDNDLGKVRHNARHLQVAVDLGTYDAIVHDFQAFLQEATMSLEALRIDAGTLDDVRRGLSAHLDRLVQASQTPLAISRYPRIVKDLSRHLGKEAVFRVGENTALARPDVWERCHNALVHLVRNAVDHGIESPETREELGKNKQGLIELEVTEDHRNIYLTLTDDGKGIDPDAVGRAAVEKGVLTPEELRQLGDEERQRLIFRPGFSTRKEVTGTSGRGVGMDAVIEEIETSLGGRLVLRSERSQGTVVRLEIPKSETLSECVVFSVDGTDYAIPKPPEVSYVDLEPARLRPVPGGSPVYAEASGIPAYPILDLTPAVGGLRVNGESPEGIVVRITDKSGTFGLLVPEVLGHRKLKIDRKKSVRRIVLDDGIVFGYALTDPVLVVLDIDHLRGLLL